jgi:hypothetical protein
VRLKPRIVKRLLAPQRGCSENNFDSLSYRGETEKSQRERERESERERRRESAPSAPPEPLAIRNIKPGVEVLKNKNSCRFRKKVTTSVPYLNLYKHRSSAKAALDAAVISLKTINSELGVESLRVWGFVV